MTAIDLGPLFPAASCDLPEGLVAGQAALCLILHLVGFTRNPSSQKDQGALTALFHPYPLRGGLVSVALSKVHTLRELPATAPYDARTFLSVSAATVRQAQAVQV